MEYIYLKARAKINPALDVLRKRDDGYHDLRMIMQSLLLYDGVYIKKVDKFPLKLVTNLDWLPADNRNLVYKAAEYMINAFDIKRGMFIELHKSIPVSAGLGGGSSDCAATLVGIKKLFKLDVSYKELMEIGKRFGADVPFCIMRGTALAEGVGEKLTQLPAHPFTYVVVARPGVSVSTASVYNSLDLSSIRKRPDIDKVVEALRKRDLHGIAHNMCNVLESVTEANHPEITDIKRVMMEHGAAGTLMSGSGPSVFGYFIKKSDATAAVRAIKTRNAPRVKELFLTGIFNKY